MNEYRPLILREMHDRGYTQSGLARLAGINQGNLSHSLNPRTRMKRRTAERVLRAMGLKLVD